MPNRPFYVHRVPLTLLLLIILLGAALRLFGLDNQSLWNDELSSWVRSNYPTLTEVINNGARTDVHPPGYHALLYLVIRFFGDSEVVLRLPSAIIGILTIPAIYLLGSELYTHREGLVVAALTATLRWPIYYSQEGRVYALLFLLAILTTYFGIKIVKRLRVEANVPLFAVAAYVVSAIAACYAHYFGLLLVGLQGVAAVLLLTILPQKWRALLMIVVVYLLVLLAYAPWLPSMAQQILNPVVQAHIPAPDALYFESFLREIFNSSRLLLLLVMVLYGALALQGIYRWWRNKQVGIRQALLSPTFLLWVWLLVPFLFTFFVSIALEPIITHRNLMISVPAAYLLLARAITTLPVGRGGYLVVTAAFVVLSLYQILFQVDYYFEPRKTQFREAVAYVVEHAPDDDDALVMGYAYSPMYFNYYFIKQNSPQRVAAIAGRVEYIPLVYEMLETQQPDYLWYLAADREPDAEFVEFLTRNFTLVEHQAFVGADVWLFQVTDEVAFPLRLCALMLCDRSAL